MQILKIDQKISKWALKRRERDGFWDALAVFVAHYFVFMIAVITIVTAELIALPTLFIAWLITLGIEFMVKRPRPFQAMKTHPLARYWVPTPSFPSAHATWSFAGAVLTCFANPVWGAMALVLAVLVSWSRVYVGVHYLSDVVAGAIVGTVVSLVVGLLW
ncbi:phosphatase PAP2 family protein [Patescibacteria group bacterium]|nr:phosphatase PAP2 family protein [Patescibacteria group bacterium]MBU1705367.1 phosphatase PAP2 family protein [Patescibacteria group bacterium]